jgi:hypothetical protein
MDRSQALIHGDKSRPVPAYPFLPAESLFQCTPQANPDVFYGMMKIYFRVSPRLNSQVKEAVGGKKAQHMIQKGNGGGNPVSSRAIQGQINPYVRLFRPAGNFSLSHGEFSLFLLSWTQIYED